jgi:hypothetical protein
LQFFARERFTDCTPALQRRTYNGPPLAAHPYPFYGIATHLGALACLATPKRNINWRLSKLQDCKPSECSGASAFTETPRIVGLPRRCFPLLSRRPAFRPSYCVSRLCCHLRADPPSVTISGSHSPTTTGPTPEIAPPMAPQEHRPGARDVIALCGVHDAGMYEVDRNPPSQRPWFAVGLPTLFLGTPPAHR